MTNTGTRKTLASLFAGAALLLAATPAFAERKMVPIDIETAYIYFRLAVQCVNDDDSGAYARLVDSEGTTKTELVEGIKRTVKDFEDRYKSTFPSENTDYVWKSLVPLDPYSSFVSHSSQAVKDAVTKTLQNSGAKETRRQLCAMGDLQAKRFFFPDQTEAKPF